MSETKKVRDLYVNCSYPKNGVSSMAASDTCQKPASTAVETPEGNLLWRCKTHEGWYDFLTPGTVHEEVPVHNS